MATKLDIDALVDITKGSWIGEIPENFAFNAVTVLSRASLDSLCVTADNTSKWKKSGVKPPSRDKLLKAGSKGVKAFIVGKDYAYDIPYPVLQVENTWDALSQISDYNRDNTKAKRILVTGSVGKTNYKLMAHHAFSPLTNIHANLSSANLNVPIWCSLASIQAEDSMAVVEVSVANPNRGKQRSKLIQPHICVLTNISSSHTSYHGSVENLIHAKAESVLSLQEGGVVLMSADHPYFVQLKDEVQRLKPVPVLTWGTEDFCDARLLTASYDLSASCWNVKAKVMGQDIDYQIGTHHSFAPVSSLGILLTAAVCNLDIAKAAKQLATYIPGDTTGRIYEVAIEDGQFNLFDYSQRGSIEGFRAALADLYRLSPANRRIIMALGESRDLSEEDEKQVHEEIASLIQVDRTAKVFTVGKGMNILRNYLSGSSVLASHGDTPEAIESEFLASIKADDIVFIQGHHRVWMSSIVKKMQQQWPFKLNLSPQNDSQQKTEQYDIPQQQNKTITPQDKEELASFIAAGDTILVRDFPGRLIEEGSDWVFRSLANDFKRADSFLLNLECVISQRGDYVSKAGEKRPFHYQAPQFVSDIFFKAGVSIVCTSNNHSMDYGAIALNEQLHLLEQMNMGFVGSGRNNEQAKMWLLQQCGDVKVAVIGFDTTAPWAQASVNSCGNFYLPHSAESIKELKPIIEQARQYAHIVMITVHWGANWKGEPKEDTKQLAHAIIDAGADVILGHSSHILQGIELYQGCPIVYDMGTFISDRVSQDRMRDSAYFELKLSKKGIHEVLVSPVYLYRCSVRRSQNSRKRILDLMFELSNKLGTHLIEREGHLVLPLAPDNKQRKIAEISSTVKARVSNKEDIKPLSANQFLQFKTDSLDPEAEVIAIGGGLEVGGYRHPLAIAPGYAFVFELRFRCFEKRDMRWRAELCFIDQDGVKTSLRYPVADGSWHHSYMGSETWYADRTLVRTPVGLKEGSYQLYWNLWARDENKEIVYWKDKYPLQKKIEHGVNVGTLLVSSSTQKGVAGVDWDKNLSFQNSSINQFG